MYLDANGGDGGLGLWTLVQQPIDPAKALPALVGLAHEEFCRMLQVAHK